MISKGIISPLIFYYRETGLVNLRMISHAGGDGFEYKSDK